MFFFTTSRVANGGRGLMLRAFSGVFGGNRSYLGGTSGTTVVQGPGRVTK